MNTARHQPPSDPTSPSRRWVFPALAAALVALGLGPPSSAASPPEAVSAWAILRTLAGPEGVATWDADLDGDGAPDTAVTYRLIGGGTALVETLFPGTGHEMETIHHLDRRGNGTRLLCTHYCGAGNQPRLVLTGGDLGPDGDAPPTLVFSFLDATNLPDPDAVHMNGVTFTFLRPDRVDAAWTVSNKGVTGPHATFAMTRRAAAGSDEPSNEEPAMTTTDAKSGTAPSDDAAIESLPTFAILMLEDDDAWASLASSERDALLAKYGAFVQGLAAQGRFVWGTPLGREAVMLAGAPGSIVRSTIESRKDVLTGIFVIRARDLAEAESIARECPALLHGERVLVRPATH